MTNPIFSLTTSYVPTGRPNLAAYMAVNADASSPEYGRMRILTMSDTSQIDGPGQSFNAMTTNETVADRLRPFLNQGAATATFGNLLTLPVGGGLLYVTPVYTQRQGSTGSYPALRFVVVRFGQSVGIGDTLQQALDQVFQGDSGRATTEEAPPAEEPPPHGGEPGQPGRDQGADRGPGRLRGRRQGADRRRPGDLPDQDQGGPGRGPAGPASPDGARSRPRVVGVRISLPDRALQSEVVRDTVASREERRRASGSSAMREPTDHQKSNRSPRKDSRRRLLAVARVVSPGRSRRGSPGESGELGILRVLLVRRGCCGIARPISVRGSGPRRRGSAAAGRPRRPGPRSAR